MKHIPWWKKAVFYQIYPRSFADSDGDGIGDMRGIIQKLDYLQDLGIDAIWLSPHYPSPLWDCGYDIADYVGVAPEYGTLDDFNEMLAGLHDRGMKLILDLVLNHTSDQHPWFLESRSSRNNPKRDWYVWQDGKNSDPPNNWCSTFGGSAWELDPQTGQYYYHFFFKQQPDLNWYNPEVKRAMFDAVRFWLDMGVDGFRLDAIGTIFEDPNLTPHSSELCQAEVYRMTRTASTDEERSTVERCWQTLFLHQHDMPGTHELMHELRAVVDEYPDRVLVGETDLIEYCGNGDDELHMVFNFPLMKTERLTPEWIRFNQEKRLAAIPSQSWPANTLNNHDSQRLIAHFGDGIQDRAIACLCLALMLTLKGAPFLYNGEEIGMTDLTMEDLRDFRDQMGVWAYHTEMVTFGCSPEDALVYAASIGRDKCRTPMQWSAEPNAGFSPAGVHTWLPVHRNYAAGINVRDQMDDPGSLLTFYRNLLRVRRQNPALTVGDYSPLYEDAPGYLAFLRTSRADAQTCLVVLNFSDQSYELNFSDVAGQARLVFSSTRRKKTDEDLSDLEIAPFEVFIAEII